MWFNTFAQAVLIPHSKMLNMPLEDTAPSNQPIQDTDLNYENQFLSGMVHLFERHMYVP